MKFVWPKKSKILFTLLGLSAVSLVYLYYSVQNHPPPLFPPVSISPTPPSQIRSRQPAVNQIKKYRIQFLPSAYSVSLPESLNLYSADYTEEDLNSIAQSLISGFRLTEHPTIANFWTSDNQLTSLLINHKNQSLYLNNSSSRNLSGLKYSLSQAVNAVRLLQNQYSFLKDLSILDSKIEYFQIPQSDHHLEKVTDPSQANLFSIPLAFRVDGYPSYHQDLPNSQAQIQVAPNNFVSKIIYISQPKLNLSNPQSYSPLSFDQIQNRLESGYGEIIGINLMDVPHQATEIPLISISQIEIEYRYNRLTRQAIPYFRLNGTYQSDFNPQSDPSSPVVIILPAVIP